VPRWEPRGAEPALGAAALPRPLPAAEKNSLNAGNILPCAETRVVFTAFITDTRRGKKGYLNDPKHPAGKGRHLRFSLFFFFPLFSFPEAFSAQVSAALLFFKARLSRVLHPSPPPGKARRKIFKINLGHSRSLLAH